MQLNLAKCTFGVTSRKFLRHLITKRGIEVNLDQIQAIQNMKAPTTQKEVQELVGRLIALSNFISRLTDRYKPIFTLLKRK